ALTLDYPLSIGVFDTYPEAQRAVDALSDAGFPVQNCLIVGTDLRQLERVTGRLTWGRVLAGGALSGLWLGLFVGLIFSLFVATSGPVPPVFSTMVFGAVFGAVWAAIGYAATRGKHDYTSVSRIVPSRFEVLAEHKVAQQARDLLAKAGIVTAGPPAA
ncbi:MAG: general stress protein, partial [Candidatus Phosphoribacter baldrii]